MKAIELAKEWDLAADDTPTECAPQFIEQCRDTAAELRRLHAENEALRKDAGRYRFLISYDAPSNMGAVLFDDAGDACFLIDSDADKAIDAAMEKSK